MNRKLSVLLAAALGSVFVFWVYYQGLRKAGVNRGEFAPPVWPLGRNGEVKILHKNGEMEFCNASEFVDFHASEAWQDCLLAFSDNRDWFQGKAWTFESGEPVTEPWLVGASDEVNSVRREGWLASSKNLRRLLGVYTESELRKAVRKYLSERGNGDATQ